MLRVLHIINDLRVGGAEVQLKDLAPRLRDAGLHVEAVALAPNPTFVEEAMRSGPVPTEVHPAGLGLYSLRQVVLLAERMRGFDVAHVHLFPAQLWGALAALQLPPGKRPVLITTEHNTHNRRRKAPLRPLDAWMYSRYRRVVCVSPPVAESLAAWAPSAQPRLTVIPTAVDVSRFADAAPADKSAVLGAPAGAPVLLSVARMEPVKEHATLLRALRELPGVHAALVGDGPLRGGLEEQARSLGVAGRAHFLGRRPDIPALLKMADVYVQPSRFEGWSVAVLEAMASGSAPVVASRAPGLEEAVEGRGYLFSPVGDAGALAAAVRSSLADAEGTARLVAAGRDWVSANYGLDQCVAAHVRLYEEVAAAHRGRSTTSSAR